MWDTEDVFEMGSRPTIVVHKADREPEWSGLYDADGDPLYRVWETVEFGFRPTIEVHKADCEPEWSGLYDADGEPLYLVRETVEFGFPR